MKAWSAVLVAVLAGGTVGYPSAALADDVRDAQRHLPELQVSEAHRHTRGGGVTVAVLGTGVDASHPDLRRNVVPGVDLTGRGTDGRDDPGGSGTALAGLIAGHGHPRDGGAAVGGPDGVLGLAPEASILPVVVAPAGSAPAPDALAAGVDEAVGRGADVICLGAPAPDHPEVTRALGAAAAADVAVVLPGAPAGEALARYRESGLVGAGPPGAAGTAGVVTVPVAGALSAGAQGGYYLPARTTGPAAAALLAGAAALVRAEFPQLPAYQVTGRLLATSGADGELDLLAALTATVPPPPSPPAGPSGPGSPATPSAAATAAPDQPERVAAFDSGDWRRWLVGLPLAAFLVVLVVASVLTARRVRRSPR